MKNIFLILFAITMVACSNEPQAINYNNDACNFCKMTIMDKKFAAECISTKGKVFKFDDVRCLVTFLKVGGVWSNEIDGIYFSDYSGNDKWVKSDHALLLKSSELHSPMGSNTVAFSSVQQRDSINKQVKGELLSWEDIKPKK